jgi:hypothetical protein
MFTSRLHRFLAGGSVLLALGGAAVPLAAAAGAATVAATAAPTKLAFFEQQSSFAQTSKTIEFTSLLFLGTKAHHAAKWTASDHYLCTFSTAGAPICEGQIAIGGSMLLISGPGGQGTFSIPIVGGTGRYHDAKGAERVQDLAGSSNSNLTLTLTRR